MSDKPAISFKEAIELGKYQVDYLRRFDEWKNLDRQIQYQYIVQAIMNRRVQLRRQWALLANQPHYSEKPQLLEAQKKVEESQRELNEDEERLMIEYAGA